ncbi:hypothetical protein HHI36_011179 [Cryptolaemus montrouzieri]|uniref:Uncharacterized protein n=1 Tax=Cryptolaemus montrouzieri TaxID=559131 RepID=A0ABD2MKZ2_9CUCU
MSKRHLGLTQEELEKLADDSMKYPDFSIMKRAPGSQWQDPTDYESSEDEDYEETHYMQEIPYKLASDEALQEENDENRELYEIPVSDVICNEYSRKQIGLHCKHWHEKLLKIFPNQKMVTAKPRKDEKFFRTDHVDETRATECPIRLLGDQRDLPTRNSQLHDVSK